MATLNNTDFQRIRELIYSDETIRNVFKSWSLSKTTWKAIFQAAEDWFTGAFNTTPSTSFKAALDSVSTTTATQAKWVGKIWFLWRTGIDW